MQLILYNEYTRLLQVWVGSYFFFLLFSHNWFSFSKLHKPLFTEHGYISFLNTNPPLDKMNNSYCEVSKELFAKL